MNKTLKLNDFISYDVDSKEIIIEEHTIKIDSSRIPITKLGFRNIDLYINSLNSISEKEYIKYDSSYAFRKSSGRIENGCGKCNTFKNGITRKLLHHIFGKYFNIFIANNKEIRLNPNRLKK